MSKKFILIASLILITGLLAMTACLDGNTDKGNTVEVNKTETNGKMETVEIDENSPITKVDFKNFEYPMMTDAKDGKEEMLTLKDGKIEKTDKSAGATLGTIQYADLTNDGKAEAIVDVKLDKGEKETTNMVYVYTLENEKPKLLWNFDANGESGLKKVSTEKGNLVVELFGDAKFVKGKWETAASKEGDKKQFTKTQLKWNGKEFAVEGSPEVKEVEGISETKKAENKKPEDKKAEDKKTEDKKIDSKS